MVELLPKVTDTIASDFQTFNQNSTNKTFTINLTQQQLNGMDPFNY